MYYVFFTDKFFTVVRRTSRGTPIAVLRSPSFRGQQCAQFRVSFQGSSLDQLNVYKDGGGEGKLMFQRNATSDQYWRYHRLTIVPTACEVFQVGHLKTMLYIFGGRGYDKLE